MINELFISMPNNYLIGFHIVISLSPFYTNRLSDKNMVVAPYNVLSGTELHTDI
jgi:hypothetical protein